MTRSSARLAANKEQRATENIASTIDEPLERSTEDAEKPRYPKRQKKESQTIKDEEPVRIASKVIVPSVAKSMPASDLIPLYLTELVDSYIPGNRSDYSVVANQTNSDCKPYHAMLNQTNLGQNNNKYFLIQIVKSRSGEYATWFRWGRVGYAGQNDFTRCASLEAAIAKFEKKFNDKTLNIWADVACAATFQPFSGKYTLIEAANDKATALLTADPVVPDEPDVIESIHEEIQGFLKLICDRRAIEAELREGFSFDSKRMPLGRLSPNTLTKALLVLTELESSLGGSRSKLSLLSSQFYTLIPHDFGFTNVAQFIIDSADRLREKADLVEALASVEVANRLIIKKGDTSLTSMYKRLGVELVPVAHGSDDWKLVEQYQLTTHASTHNNYSCQIVRILKLGKEENASHGRTLLWHGSRLSNWCSILKQGLRIAPPEAPSTGYMFGKGVYFADCFSKSANYCFVNSRGRGVIALCEVDLGESLTIIDADYNAAKRLGNKYHSVLAEGSSKPKDFEQTDNGRLKVPVGPLIKRDDSVKRSLLYNEYIVYDASRVRMKYLVELDFTPQESYF